MKIEAGKYYKTRDGRKVGPMEPSTTQGWPWEINDGSYDRSLGTRWAWREDGTFHECSDRPAHDLDLIAEWTEGPVRTVTRREVVEGSYGRLVVCPHEPGTVLVGFEHPCDLTFVSLTSAELKAAAAVLLELAGALEDVS